MYGIIIGDDISYDYKMLNVLFSTFLYTKGTSYE